MTGAGNSESQPGPLRVSTWWGRILVGRNPAVTLIRLVVLVVVASVLFKGVLIPVRVTGKSMEPTYRDGRVNFINRLAYRRSEPRRGDVVGLQTENSRLLVLKRIVGLPGERVSIRYGRIYIDGKALAEDYTDGQPIPPTLGERKLGAVEYFVIGDNRDLSAYGVVERRHILGKVLF
ncbi:MAG: signal peptidase I [Verrucomicrobia bacterium]|nr:signal peptidase I [Verrucomicrobiota bacterium]